MILIDFFQKEVRLDTRRVVIALIGSGLANAALLVIINISAEQSVDAWERSGLLFGYVAALLIYLFAQRFTLDQSITAVEQALGAMRIRLFDKICQQRPDCIEQYAEVGDYAPLVKDTNLLAQGTTQFILAIQNGMVLLLAIVYLAFLSVTTFYVLLVIIALAIPFYRANFAQSRRFLTSSSQHESVLLHYLQKIRDGFRQIKSDAAEAAGLATGAQMANEKTSQSRVLFNANMVNNIIFSNAIFYVFLLIVVFVLPLFVAEHEALLYQIISTVLFIMVPVLTLVLVVPMLARTT
ncbi:MAG: ABC transporter transmembrane domain-containing protein, partial [Pseudomonadota bacterium]